MIVITLDDILNIPNNYHYKDYYFNDKFIYQVNPHFTSDDKFFDTALERCYIKVKDVEGLNREQIIAEIDSLTRKDNFLKDFNKIINE